ncbi:hypothetical protein XENTR_v10004727 [Xenopus tropicalis]|nr:hypothetical protein XENTR_v10004727 [Xenopus tropicalis]
MRPRYLCVALETRVFGPPETHCISGSRKLPPPHRTIVTLGPPPKSFHCPQPLELLVLLSPYLINYIGFGPPPRGAKHPQAPWIYRSPFTRDLGPRPPMWMLPLGSLRDLCA